MIPREIFNLGVEALSGHNDGWVKDICKKQLTAKAAGCQKDSETYLFIQRVLRVFVENSTYYI